MSTHVRSVMALLVAMSAAAPAAALYSQTNLVSDLQGVAAHQDANLVNPWGMSFGPGTPIWVSDNGTGVSTLYTAAGSTVPLVVTVPGAGVTPTSAPTGQVFNSTSDFELGNGNPANFIFASEDGTISGWNGASGTTAIREVLPVNGAVYKGLALDSIHSVLLAPDFANASIDTFGPDFRRVSLSGGNFTDPALPSGFSPFNVAIFGTSIFVSYAKKGTGIDDVPGVGNGYVDVFSLSGAFQQRLISGGVLNSPWGMAMAPGNFGEFSNALLVGNFGDGLIHAYDPTTGQLLGTLESSPGHSIQIDGLWALLFGGGSANNGSTDTLFFTAGIAGPGAVEDHGLFGSLTAVPEPSTGAELALGTLALALRARRRRPRR